MARVNNSVNDILDRVLLVAASVGIKDYERYSVYICEPNRFSRDSAHMAFYFNGHIHNTVPQVLGVIDSIILSKYQTNNVIQSMRIMVGSNAELNERIVELKNKMQVHDDDRFYQTRKIIFLTSIDDQRTLKLHHKIPNNKLSKNGKSIRFVQSQRYFSLKHIQRAKTTSELEDLETVQP